MSEVWDDRFSWDHTGKIPVWESQYVFPREEGQVWAVRCEDVERLMTMQGFIWAAPGDKEGFCIVEFENGSEADFMTVNHFLVKE